jgi:hypothetical protein
VIFISDIYFIFRYGADYWYLLVADAIIMILVLLNFVLDSFYLLDVIIFTACFVKIIADVIIIKENIENFNKIKETLTCFIISCLIGINSLNSDIQMILILLLCLSQIIILGIEKRFHLKKLADCLQKCIFSWNLLDSIRIIICCIWIYSIYNNDLSEMVTYALAIITFIRGLTAFRSFDGTRYYIRLIFNSIRDISSFMIIFFFSTLCFGIISGVSRKTSEYKTPWSYQDVWVHSYYINLGEFRNENEKFDLFYIAFFSATVFNVIIMLNLLISILGDSFDKFQLSSQEIDCMEMTQVILEIESMMFYRSRQNDNKMYLVVCENESTVKQEWDGKILIVQRKLDEMNSDFDRNEKIIEDKIAESKKILDELRSAVKC